MDVSSLNSAMQTCDKMKMYVSTGIETIIDTAMDMIDHTSDIDQNRTNELKDLLCEYVDMELQMKQLYEAVDYAKEAASRFKDGDDVPRLEEIFDKKLDEISERDENFDVKDHVKYKDLQERIQNKFVGAQSVDEMEDEEVQLTEAELTTKCPVTGKDMVEPVINTICKHSYDKDGVKQLIKQRKGKAKCPVIGCDNREPITEGHLKEDRDMKRLLAKKKRKENVKAKKK